MTTTSIEPAAPLRSERPDAGDAHPPAGAATRLAPPTPPHLSRRRRAGTDLDASIDAASRPDLELVKGGAEIDLPRAERAVAELLAALGQDVTAEHTRDTPRRWPPRTPRC